MFPASIWSSQNPASASQEAWSWSPVGVESFTLLWDSSVQVFPGEVAYRPGMTVPIAGASVQLYLANEPENEDPAPEPEPDRG